MTYDAFGRMISTTHVYASGATASGPTTTLRTDTWTNSYDIQGRHTQETSPTGFINYEYDLLGRKTKTESGTTVPAVLSEATYTYDSLSRLKTINTVKRDGSAITPETTTQNYDLLGRMDYTELPNSVVEDYTFDNMDRLDIMRHFQSDSNNANLADNVLKDMFDYSYRADGKRTGLNEYFSPSNSANPPASSLQPIHGPMTTPDAS